MADLAVSPSRNPVHSEVELVPTRVSDASARKPPHRSVESEPLLTADQVARRLNVSSDWVWDHSSRKKPYLPVIRMGDGTLRYRPSEIEEFVNERERLSSMRLKRA
jgi:predicted DNA-binding transcriptional regulator AlpA